MRRSFDPLTFIPSPSAIRKHLAEAQELASRLKILLRVSERIEATKPVQQSCNTKREAVNDAQ